MTPAEWVTMDGQRGGTPAGWVLFSTVHGDIWRVTIRRHAAGYLVAAVTNEADAPDAGPLVIVHGITAEGLRALADIADAIGPPAPPVPNTPVGVL